MEKYMVTGMSCAACQARVEKAVSNVEGVTECNVNLLTNSMGVSGNADTAAIIKAVEDAGYGASLMEDAGASKEKASVFSAEEEALRDKETPQLKKRLVTSIGFLIVLMYFSMGHMMFGFPLPSFFDGNHVAMGIVQMLLAIIVMVINKKFFISGFKGLIHRAPNMDTLVALGSAASFGYSVVALFLMTDAQVKGDTELVMHYMDEFYFESAAMILTLITVGKMLEAMSKGRTTDAIKSLMKLAPKTANIIDEKGNEKTVSIDSVAIGDIFTVRPGENVPVDGIIVEGNTSIDESALTGESIPVDKSVGSEVSAATINTAGFIKCRATRVVIDTTLSQIIQMVSDAAATKAPIAKIADRVSGVFVPAVIGIALLTIVVWCILGAEFGYALARGIAVLVISCPCALGLATPVAIMVGNGMGAKNGIMFKTAASLENAGKTQIVALDKTGTITMGEPVVTDVFSADSITRSGYSASNYESFDDKLLAYAGIIEQKSEHPLAKAITKYVTDLHIDWEFENMEFSDFKAVFGNGLEANVDGHIIRGGNRDFISKFAVIPGEILEKATALAMQGKTPMYFARDNKLLGIIAVADTIKEDSAKAISELKNMGIRVVMLTGDNEKTAKAIAGKAGVDDYVAGVLPDGKEEIIRKLSEKGKVAMVGDGINDAPALTRADTGIAIGAGTDIAIDAADVVLMKSSLLDVSGAIRLSRATLRNIHQNLFWAFFYNVLGIPLAAGCYIKLFGWALSPMFGAAAMSLSSFFVVTNALRLNFFNLHDASKDKKIKNAITEDISADFGRKGPENTESDTEANNNSMEENTMTKTMKIEGMMCEHCEARVKKALENLDAVESAVVSHEEGTAVVTLSGDVENDSLKKAVEDEDYKVVSIS